MKVLFVYKNAEWMGVEYLSSMLKSAGHETDLVFDPGAGDIEYKIPFVENIFPVKQMMVEKAVQYQPDLIAFSCLTNMWGWVKEMAASFKSRLDVPIIVGGLHPTVMPEAVISYEHIDMICVGEGEDALLELVNSMEAGAIDSNIQNLWFKKEGMVTRNNVRSFRQNLDELPIPDKELFFKYGCFKDRLYTMTARGCPYSCTYCFNDHYKTKTYEGKGAYVRQRNVANVINELKIFMGRYPIKEVFFYDDIFTLNEEWLNTFYGEYKQNIGLPFKCLIKPGTVKSEMAYKLKDAGLVYADVGIESGDEMLRRKHLKRRMSDSTIFETADILKNAGISFTTLNIAGFPGETASQMFKTLRMNQELKPTTALFSTFYPYPGTELGEKVLKKGYISEAGWKKLSAGTGSYRENSVLRLPENETVKWITVFAPILVKVPWLENVCQKLSPNSFWRFITIFFSSPIRNSRIRLFEVLRMYVKTRRELHKNS